MVTALFVLIYVPPSGPLGSGPCIFFFSLLVYPCLWAALLTLSSPLLCWTSPFFFIFIKMYSFRVLTRTRALSLTWAPARLIYRAVPFRPVVCNRRQQLSCAILFVPLPFLKSVSTFRRFLSVNFARNRTVDRTESSERGSETRRQTKSRTQRLPPALNGIITFVSRSLRLNRSQTFFFLFFTSTWSRLQPCLRSKSYRLLFLKII